MSSLPTAPDERKALEHLHLALLLTTNKGAIYNIIAAKSWILSDLKSTGELD